MPSDTSHTLTNMNWPIAAAMIQYPNILPDGSSVQDQTAEQWSETVSDVSGAGFSEIDPTDSWIRIADLSPARRNEFLAVLRDHGLTIPAISTARRSIIDPERGSEFLEYSHRLLDVAAEIGAKHVSFGLFGPLTEAQKKVTWFWTVDGVKNPDDPAIYKRAVEGYQELGKHAESVGVDIALEMYEDTYVGSADGAVKLLRDINHPAVGLNPDLGNLIRLHRPMERWQSMVEKTMPYVKYWHAKNYFRDEVEAEGFVATSPAPLELGLISYRVAVKQAIGHGFRGAFCLEHYGGDGLSVCATNREYLRRILPKSLGSKAGGPA